MPRVEYAANLSKRVAKLLRKHPDKRSKLERAIRRLEADPRDPALQTRKYDEARGVWQSNVEQGTPAAWRIWWHWHDQEPGTIVVIDLGPHP